MLPFSLPTLPTTHTPIDYASCTVFVNMISCQQKHNFTKDICFKTRQKGSYLPIAAPAGESKSDTRSKSIPGPNSSSLLGKVILHNAPNMFPTTSWPNNLTI